ncbi:hypothetical protein K8O68_07725 [Salipaludibacillus sp. CUR1]|uniref:hypothetical protein n=1 Tax=Salipaludibacillus sp. CUR1 TaxID=2820003 RepID=UPI001E4A9A9D|nr:hypothetical protein [Salipaludibacillus sp. CUR1]MCE7792308.1 hypothetical protein [Salipaludibacillus sp. CUR1]
MGNKKTGIENESFAEQAVKQAFEEVDKKLQRKAELEQLKRKQLGKQSIEELEEKMNKFFEEQDQKREAKKLDKFYEEHVRKYGNSL